MLVLKEFDENSRTQVSVTRIYRNDTRIARSGVSIKFLLFDGHKYLAR